MDAPRTACCHIGRSRIVPDSRKTCRLHPLRWKLLPARLLQQCPSPRRRNPGRDAPFPDRMTMTDPLPRENVNTSSDGGDASSSLPPEVREEGQGNEIATLVAERDAAQQGYLRALADHENYRRRVMKERDEDRKFASYSLIRDLLPSLDNLRRAVDAARATAGSEQIVQGVGMVLKQIDEVFERQGAKPIVAVGQPFDPNLHEAIQQLPSADHPAMTVLQEAERGYTLHDRVVRPSKVLVSKRPD